MTDIYWFRSDLRTEDNPGLQAHCEADKLLCVFFWPPEVPWCNLKGLGGQRERFLIESLEALGADLAAQGQTLQVYREAPGAVLPRLVDQYQAQRIGVARIAGSYERLDVEDVAARVTVPVEQHDGNTLFSAELLQSDMPPLKQFTPFRRRVESLPFVPPSGRAQLPPPPKGAARTPLAAARVRPDASFAARGGAKAGKARLNAWMHRERAVSSYKETRNQLGGLFFASFLSPWLANGSLSVRKVASELQQFEGAHGQNDSTGHFYSELLWREFFQWRALADDGPLFRVSGTARERKLATFDPRGFARWCAGATNYPLVNALMHQLVASGWMSNRGRQIAASCLINEMNVDWRFGAAFFEQQLLDYDVASNYGNWQYIAGVGADPRGGRHFDIAKQTHLYDPDAEFIRQWEGECPKQPEHIVDAADWPLETS
ncbi:MAG: DASH family cryptochrome [Halioglobus sp.]